MSRRPRPAPRRRGAVFGVPLLIGIASIAALVIGLLGDGGFDLLAWAGLSLPVVAIMLALLARRA